MPKHGCTPAGLSSTPEIRTGTSARRTMELAKNVGRVMVAEEEAARAASTATVFHQRMFEIKAPGKLAAISAENPTR